MDWKCRVIEKVGASSNLTKLNSGPFHKHDKHVSFDKNSINPKFNLKPEPLANMLLHSKASRHNTNNNDYKCC